MGYTTEFIYKLVFKDNTGKLFKRYPVEIWRATHSGASQGYCPYSSMSAFLENWEIIKIL